jgi:hypothetical protein
MDGVRVAFTRTAVLSAAVMAIAVLAAPAAQAAKPDLVIAGQSTLNPDYFFRGEGTNATFTDRTKNKGKAKAGPSKTALLLLHPPQVRERMVASRDVPKLKPGKSDFGQGGDPVADSFPPGAYDAIVCADHKNKVKESNESNNCSPLDRVYVVVRSWFGTLSGNGPAVPGVTETWQSDDASFHFAENLGDGRFRYEFAGTLQFTVSGTDAEGCSWSGSDSTTLPGGADVAGQGLILDYRKEEYFGNSGVGGFPFVWQQTCPDEPPQDQPGPANVAGGFIVVNPQEVDLPPMPFGSTSLTGTATNENNGSQYGWLLGAGN